MGSLSNGDIFNELRGALTRFQDHGILVVESVQNGAYYGRSCYRTVIGNHT